MNDQVFHQAQVVELERLFESSKGDPVLEYQLKQRLERARSKRDAASSDGTLFPRVPRQLPRTAIFLRGDGVEGTLGIRPSLAGDAMVQYERMFSEQAIVQERVAAKRTGRQRRPKGAKRPTLLLTATPRGSFGLEFTPRVNDEDDDALVAVHKVSLDNITSFIESITNDSTFESSLEVIPPSVLHPLKQFLNVLASHKAELRIAFPDRAAFTIGHSAVSQAFERLSREVTQDVRSFDGVFRGVTLESGVFDLRLEDGNVITGQVSDELTETDLERLSMLQNLSCQADIQVTTIQRPGKSDTTNYVLLDAKSPAPQTKALNDNPPPLH